MAELNIGKHCSVRSCKQLDFLPFQCNGCSGTFCLNHRSYDAHCCSQANVAHDHKDSLAPTSYACRFLECPETELIPVVCPHCESNFCLRHRHQRDHDCPKLEEMATRMTKTAELVQEIQESYKAKEAATGKRKIGAKSRKTAAKVALMKLKMNALGDGTIPQTERVYFRVVLPRGGHGGDLRSQSVFFSSVWSVGRAVDKVAAVAKVKNDNNVAAAKKLRLFHPETGGVLPMDSRLGTLLEGETPLYNGGSLVLEYVDDACTNLDNVDEYL